MNHFVNPLRITNHLENHHKSCTTNDTVNHTPDIFIRWIEFVNATWFTGKSSWILTIHTWMEGGNSKLPNGILFLRYPDKLWPIKTCRFMSMFQKFHYLTAIVKYCISYFSRIDIGYWMMYFKHFIVFFQFLAHLACMPMSLCNHDLSIMCHCCHCWCHHHHHCWCHLCTAVPVIALPIETSYLAHAWTYISSICTWNIGVNVTYIFEMAAILAKFLMWLSCPTWLSLEPSYLAQLCIYTGATYRIKIMHLQIIFLKLWIKKIHFALFGSHTCQGY